MGPNLYGERLVVKGKRLVHHKHGVKIEKVCYNTNCEFTLYKKTGQVQLGLVHEEFRNILSIQHIFYIDTGPTEIYNLFNCLAIIFHDTTW